MFVYSFYMWFVDHLFLSGLSYSTYCVDTNISMCVELILFVFRYGADTYLDRVAVGDVLYSEEDDTDEFGCLSNTEKAVHCFCFEIMACFQH